MWIVREGDVDVDVGGEEDCVDGAGEAVAVA